MFRIGKVNGSARGESHQIDCGRDEAIILLLYVSDFFVQYYNIWIEFFSDRVCKVFSFIRLNLFLRSLFIGCENCCCYVR